MTFTSDHPAARASEMQLLTLGDVIEILGTTEMVPCAPFHALYDWLVAQSEERA